MPGLFSAVALFIKQLTLLAYVKNNAFPQSLAEDEEDKHLKLVAQGNQHSRKWRGRADTTGNCEGARYLTVLRIRDREGALMKLYHEFHKAKR